MKMNKLEINNPNSMGTGLGLVLDAVADDVRDASPNRYVRMRLTAQGANGFRPIKTAYMDDGHSKSADVGIEIPPCVLRHMLGRTLRNGEATKFSGFDRESRLVSRLSLGWMEFADCVRVDIEVTRKGEALFCGSIALFRGACERIYAFCESVEGGV